MSISAIRSDRPRVKHERQRRRSWRSRLGDLDEVQIHCLGIAGGQDEGGAFSVLWADRAEDIGRGGTFVGGACGRVPRLARRRVILFFWPMRASSWNQISNVASTTFFMACDFLQVGREAFLNSSITVGLSMMPVREAIRRLEHLGLVEVEPHRGAEIFLRFEKPLSLPPHLRRG